MTTPEALLRRNSTRKSAHSKRSSDVISSPKLPESILPAHPPTSCKPSETLIGRANSLKVSVRMLLSFFETQAKLETVQQKAIEKEAHTMEGMAVDFSHKPIDSTQTSLEHFVYEVQGRIKLVAAQHEAAQRSFDAECLQPLKQIKLDIKNHIKGIDSSVATGETKILEWREASANALMALKQSLALFHAQSADLTSTTEPYIANRNAKAVLERQLLEENDLVRTTLAWQSRSKTFEEGILEHVKTVWKAFSSWKTAGSTTMQRDWTALADLAAGLSSESWADLEASGKLLPQNQLIRDIHALEWPGQDDPAVKPLKEGALERKRRFTALYKKRYFVLTPIGYLHEFELDSDPVEPRLSLFLRSCVLGPMPDKNAKRYTFWIGGSKSMTGTLERSMKRSLKLGAGEIQYTWKFTHFTELQDWWSKCSDFCKASYTANEQGEHEPQPAIESNRAGDAITEEESGYESSVTEAEAVKSDRSSQHRSAEGSVRFADSSAARQKQDGALKEQSAAASQEGQDSPAPQYEQQASPKAETSQAGSNGSRFKEEGM